MATNTIARSLNDLGLAGWFGSSLMGAVAVNRAAGDVDTLRDRSRFANGVWSRWWKPQVACIAAANLGGIGLTLANRGRLGGQRGVASTAAAKAALLTTATAASLYADVLGTRMGQAGPTPIEDATTPVRNTDPEVAAAQRQMARLQWAIPVLLAGVVMLDARLGEQQRPAEVASGLLDRLLH